LHCILSSRNACAIVGERRSAAFYRGFVDSTGSENENYVIAAENFSDTSNKKFASIKQEKIVDVRTKNCTAPERD
jgi:hypothetical protein